MVRTNPDEMLYIKWLTQVGSSDIDLRRAVLANGPVNDRRLSYSRKPIVAWEVTCTIEATVISPAILSIAVVYVNLNFTYFSSYELYSIRTI